MPQVKGDPKGWYVMPKDYRECRNYIERHMSHWLIPYELTFRSGLRPFETGLTRRKGERVTLKSVYPLADSPYSQIQIKGKQGKYRRIDVPYSVDEITEWYKETAPEHKLESYEQFIYRQKLRSYCGRKTFCTNMVLIFSSDILPQAAIRAMTGHIDNVQMDVYIGESYSIKRLLTPEDLSIIEEMLSHINLPRR